MASNDNKDTDWKLCFLCQTDKKNKEKCRSTKEGIHSLSKDLFKFYNVGELNFTLNELCKNENNLAEYLIDNNAKYHHSCRSKYNDSHYQKITKKQEKRKLEDETWVDNSPGPSKRRSYYKSSTFQLGKRICCFCEEEDQDTNLRAAGTLHASDGKLNLSHVERFTKEWKSMAALLGETDLLVRLSGGDIASNEVYYHDLCYFSFRNKYNRKIKHNEDKTREQR